MNKVDKDLQQFSEMLAPPEEYVNRCKMSAENLFRLLQSRSQYKADRCRVVGGLEKKTSTGLKVDADLVVFVNEDPGDILKTKENILSDWYDILLLNTSLTEDQVKQSKFSLKFTYGGIDIDLLPAVNFSSDVSKQKRCVMEFIGKSEDSPEAASNASAELSEVALEFIKNKSKFCHDLARLAKFWSQTILFAEYVSGRSTMIETMAVKAAQDEEKKNANNRSYKAAFQAFFKMVMDMAKGNGQLIFYDNYGPNDIPSNIKSKKPLLLDPTNPFNNLLSTEGFSKAKKGSMERFLKTFGDCAQNSLRLLSIEPFGPSLMFMPQPLLWKTPIPRMFRIGNRSYLVGVQEYHDLMPRMTVRKIVPPSVEESLKQMLHVYMGALKGAEVEYPDASSGDLQRKLAQLVNLMENENYNWVSSCNEKHEDKAVTLMMPLHAGGGRLKGKAMFLSFNIEMM